MFFGEEPDILDAIRKAKDSAESPAEREKFIKAERLVKLQRSYAEVNRFRVGDLVMWKDGMRNRRSPGYGQVVIVSAVYDSISYGPEKSSGSPYFREPETMKIAFIDEDDGEFMEFCVDKQRFRIVSEDECVPRKVQLLRSRLETLLSQGPPLKVGDRVYWKPNMKHKKRPNKEPAIVMEVLSQPLLDEDRAGSQYWHEPMDVKIGMADNDGEFVAFFFDSRRFQKIDDDDETYGKDDGDDDDLD